MPRITKIKPQKNKKRVNIYLDGKFGFGLDLENYLKLNLKVNQELEEKKIKEIIKKSEFQKIFDKLLRFVSLRPRSEREVSMWLKKKKVHPSIEKDLFNRLKRMKLLNDFEFAKWWVEQRVSFRPRGYRALKSELSLKGVERKTVDKVLSLFDLDEVKIAEKLLKKNEYKWSRVKGMAARKKKSDFLARKGFNWEVISKVIS